MRIWYVIVAGNSDAQQCSMGYWCPGRNCNFCCSKKWSNGWCPLITPVFAVFTPSFAAPSRLRLRAVGPFRPLATPLMMRCYCRVCRHTWWVLCGPATSTSPRQMMQVDATGRLIRMLHIHQRMLRYTFVLTHSHFVCLTDPFLELLQVRLVPKSKVLGIAAGVCFTALLPVGEQSTGNWLTEWHDYQNCVITDI